MMQFCNCLQGKKNYIELVGINLSMLVACLFSYLCCWQHEAGENSYFSFMWDREFFLAMYVMTWWRKQEKKITRYEENVQL